MRRGALGSGTRPRSASGLSANETVGLYSYLASDESSFLTGAVIPLDGGAAIVDVSGAAMTRLVQSVQEAADRNRS